MFQKDKLRIIIMRVSLAKGKALVRGISKELCFLERRLLGEKND